MSQIPDALQTLLGDMDEYDRSCVEKLRLWGINAGMSDDPVALFMLEFFVAYEIRAGASPLTLARYVAQLAALAEAELDRRRQGGQP